MDDPQTAADSPTTTDRWPTADSTPPDDETIDQLEPLTLAPALSQSPTDIPIGSRDTMVPCAQSRLLAQSVPHARVDTRPVGHEALFITPPLKQTSIVRFIERALEID